MTLNVNRCGVVGLWTAGWLVACAPDKGATDSEEGSGTGGATATGDELSGSATGQPTSGDSLSAGTVDPTDPADTGAVEETGQTSDSDGDGCVDTPTPLALEDDTPLGFTPAQALAGQTGPRSGTATWTPDGFVHADLKGTSMPITLRLEYTGGPIVFVESSPGVNGVQELPEPIFCESRLEITVDVELTSEGGELAERREGVVRTTAVGSLQLTRLELVPPGFMGSFTPAQIVDPPLTLESFDVGAELSPSEAGGSFNGGVSDPMLGSLGYGVLASVAVGAPTP